MLPTVQSWLGFEGGTSSTLSHLQLQGEGTTSHKALDGLPTC